MTSTPLPPQVGSKVRATTTTKTEQRVVVEVSAIERETESGWFVWGYRQHRGTRPRQSMYPCLYFVRNSTPTNGSLT